MKEQTAHFLTEGGAVRNAAQWDQSSIVFLNAATDDVLLPENGRLIPGDEPATLIATYREFRAPARLHVERGFVEMIYRALRGPANGGLHLASIQVEIGKPVAGGLLELRPFGRNGLAVELEGEAPLPCRIFVYARRTEGRLHFSSGRAHCAITLADRELPIDTLEVVASGGRGRWVLRDPRAPLETPPRWAQGPAATTADILPN